LIGGFQADIGQGNSKRVQEYKKRGEEVLEAVYKLEAPYVLKDIHREVVQIMQYLVDQNEKALFDQEDPLEMGLYLGKIQSTLERLALVNGKIQDVLAEYEIEEIGFADQDPEEDNKDEDDQEEESEEDEDSEKSNEDERGEQEES
jgi:cobalamin biosynthesis protein CobT